MKRKGFTLVLTLMFLCCLFGCQKNEKVNIRQMQTSRLQRAGTVSELQENIDLIVVVTPKSQENISDSKKLIRAGCPYTFFSPEK